MPASNNNIKSSSAEQQSSHGTTTTTTTTTTATGDNNMNNTSNSRTIATSTSVTRSNMRRCDEMLQYQREIAALQTKLHTLQQEQERMARLAALQTCPNPSLAAYQWSQLHKHERWNKDIVLALLTGGGQGKANNSSTSRMGETVVSYLPVPLRLHKWGKKVPRHLRQDRDVVLARLQRHDLFCGIPASFASTSSTKSTTSTTSSSLLTIPAPLQNDLPVVLATIRRCPDVLLHVCALVPGVPPPSQLLQSNSSSSRSNKQQPQAQEQQQQQQQQSLLELHADSHLEILQTLLEAFRHHDDNGNSNTGLSMRTSTSRQELFNRFSTLDTVIRENPIVMMQVWKEWVLPGHLQVNKTLFGPVLQNDKKFALQLAAAVAAVTTSNENDNINNIMMPNSTTFPANALYALSKTLQADIDVVLAYCAANGHNFVHISNTRLQQSWQVIKTASLQNPSVVLRNLAPSTKKRLSWTKVFLLQLLERLVEINKTTSRHGNDTATDAAEATTADAAKVVWSYCSPKIRRDRQVFMAALRAGAEMQYLVQTSSLSSDFVAASTMTTMALSKQNSKSSKNNNKHQRQEGRNSTTIPSFLLEQRELWVDLLCSGHLPWNELPKTLKRDKEFAIACLLYHENNDNQSIKSHGIDSNHHQPQSQEQQNYNKPLATEMVRIIVEHCPHAVTDPRMVVTWIQHYHGAVCSCSSKSSFFYATTTAPPVVMSSRRVCPCLDMYFETLPLSTRQNKSIMLRACRVNPAVILYLPVALREDRDIVECVLLHSSCPSTPLSASRGQRPLASLQYVSAMAQHLHPDLVAQAIRQLPKPRFMTNEDDINGFHRDSEGNAWSIWDVYDDIDEDLWVNRDLALAWVERGGPYLHDDFSEDFENDAELFLEIATSPNNWDDFMFASETLLTDRDFMAKAVKRNGRVLKEAKNGLDKDFDLALIAFAHTENLVNHYNWKCPEVLVSAGTTGTTASKNLGGDFVFLVDFAKNVRTELMCHDSFVELLFCIHLSNSTLTPSATTNIATTEDSESNTDNLGRRDGNGGNRRRGGKDAVRSTIRAGGGGADGVRGKEHKRCHTHGRTADPPPSSGKNGHVYLLAQGAETTLGFTKLVAEYMGIPTGKRLRLLRRASQNLARWGF